MLQEESAIYEILNKYKIDYQRNVSLREITKVSGGYCAFYCVPESEKKLVLLLRFCLTKNIVFEVIGGSTNTYFCAQYNPLVVISTIRVCRIVAREDHIICSCGVGLSKFSQYCVNRGIAGYEGFVGIPGTIGGAAICNSGAFDSEMSQVVSSVKILMEDNHIEVLTNAQLDYSKRSSAIKSGKIRGYILSVSMDSTQKKDINSLKTKVSTNTKYRKRFIDGKRKSLGSVFVSSSLRYITKQYRFRLFVKRMIYGLLKAFIQDSERLKTINTWLFFLVLGAPHLSQHCDNINRFCWNQQTTEDDFFDYISTMQRLGLNKLELEIELKEKE
tara:strand:+ start:1364 stop:2353 length:990 start_codon:yes stop_codon:yes gene_type:complete